MFQAHTQTHTHRLTDEHTHTYTHMHTQVNTHRHIHTHTHTHAQTHTNTHTHTHTHSDRHALTHRNTHTHTHFEESCIKRCSSAGKVYWAEAQHQGQPRNREYILSIPPTPAFPYQSPNYRYTQDQESISHESMHPNRPGPIPVGTL